MRIAYIDTSAVLAIALEQSGARAMRSRTAADVTLLSSNLLEAELRAAFARERMDYDTRVTQRVNWIVPDRALSIEIERVLKAGYASGGDCWHLATALYVWPDPAGIHFLTLDSRQRKVAEALGFSV